MAELSEQERHILNWAQGTFGPVQDLTRLSARAAAELEELQEIVPPLAPDLVEADAAGAIAEEAADVVILLARLCAEMGLSLEAAIDQKMIKNTGRVWDLAGDGTGQHSNPE